MALPYSNRPAGLVQKKALSSSLWSSFCSYSLAAAEELSFDQKHSPSCRGPHPEKRSGPHDWATQAVATDTYEGRSSSESESRDVIISITPGCFELAKTGRDSQVLPKREILPKALPDSSRVLRLRLERRHSDSGIRGLRLQSLN